MKTQSLLTQILDSINFLLLFLLRKKKQTIKPILLHFVTFCTETKIDCNYFESITSDKCKKQVRL